MQRMRSIMSRLRRRGNSTNRSSATLQARHQSQSPQPRYDVNRRSHGVPISTPQVRSPNTGTARPTGFIGTTTARSDLGLSPAVTKLGSETSPPYLGFATSDVKANETVFNDQPFFNPTQAASSSAWNSAGLHHTTTAHGDYQFDPTNSADISRQASSTTPLTSGWPGLPGLSHPLTKTDVTRLAGITGLTEEKVRAIMDEFDRLTGSANSVDKAKFQSLVLNILLGPRHDMQRICEQAASVFEKFDHDKSGYLDFPEFVVAYSRMLENAETDRHYEKLKTHVMSLRNTYNNS